MAGVPVGTHSPPTSSFVPGSGTILDLTGADCGQSSHSGWWPLRPHPLTPSPFGLKFLLNEDWPLPPPQLTCPREQPAESLPAELGSDASVTASGWQELL